MTAYVFCYYFLCVFIARLYHTFLTSEILQRQNKLILSTSLIQLIDVSLSATTTFVDR